MNDAKKLLTPYSRSLVEYIIPIILPIGTATGELSGATNRCQAGIVLVKTQIPDQEWHLTMAGMLEIP